MKTTEPRDRYHLDENTLQVNLPNKQGYERIAMECSASFARLAGFSRDRVEDLKTAVAEACINAMEHGNQWRSEARVIVLMKYEDRMFTVSVIDEGQGIVQLPEDPDIIKKVRRLQPTRGLGIFLIRQLVDRLEFNRRSSEGHVLRMVLQLRQENPGPAGRRADQVGSDQGKGSAS